MRKRTLEIKNFKPQETSLKSQLFNLAKGFRADVELLLPKDLEPFPIGLVARELLEVSGRVLVFESKKDRVGSVRMEISVSHGNITLLLTEV